MITTRWVYGALVVGAGSLAAAPAAAAPDTTRLAVVVEAAMDANPDLAAAWLAVEASEARVAPQGAWADPMLSFGLMNRPVAGFGTGERMTMNTLQLSQRIPWPGKLGARTDRATLLARAQSADAVGLDVVQLSGDETAEDCAGLPRPGCSRQGTQGAARRLPAALERLRLTSPSARRAGAGTRTR